jgi:hypothetical protein
MQINSRVLGGVVGLIAIAVLIVGFVIARPVMAQEEATSSGQVVESTPPIDTVSSSNTGDTVADVPEVTPAVDDASASETVPDQSQASTESNAPEGQVAGASTTAEDAEQSAPPPPPPPPTQPPPPPPANTTSTDGLVEVQLQCSTSYTGPLYDTPSGHLDAGYFLGTESASTTGMTVAHQIGEQAWTVCHDARGHEHEFEITATEYDALKIRGMPQKSVMESPEDAALDSFAETANE